MRRLHVIADLPLRPCAEDFAAMPAAPGGRHCDHCHETVHDLSALTRRAAENFLRARADRPSCYRYLARRDGTIVFAPEPPRRAAPVLSLTLAACAPWGPPPEPAIDDVPLEYAAPASIVIPTRPSNPPLDDPPDPRLEPPLDDPPDPRLATSIDPPPSRPRIRHLPPLTPESEPLLTPKNPQEPIETREDDSHIMGIPW